MNIDERIQTLQVNLGSMPSNITLLVEAVHSDGEGMSELTAIVKARNKSIARLASEIQ